LSYWINKARWRSSGKGSLKAPLGGGASHPRLLSCQRAGKMGTLLLFFRLPEKRQKSSKGGDRAT